ncbi:Phosphatidic acid phosphatase [Pedobacter cryoconitis]|uniref:Phosphatidic acid phosphatase n=1 Tax=Pedobacter cryoconitis TaxID=188932 RepID=A0A127VAS4_9SPHI|nr:phosphatase PAP2 family protein [Pedobacter cryoconitis]AMP98317.1 Phosphatidic acid phosphatase [Pedobacter cryoconitis]
MAGLLKKYIVVLQLIFCAAIPLKSAAQGGLSPDNPIQSIDNRIMIDLSEHRTPAQTNVFMFLSRYNNLVNVAVPVGIFTAGVIDNDKGTRQNAMYIASSSAVNLLLTLVIKKIVKRPRPFLGQIKINAVYHPGQTSFPSGHTSSAFTTATALTQVYHKWYVIAPAYLWASSVGYSRMYLGVHYPSDVATGALVGTGTSLSMGFLRPGH